MLIQLKNNKNFKWNREQNISWHSINVTQRYKTILTKYMNVYCTCVFEIICTKLFLKTITLFYILNNTSSKISISHLCFRNATTNFFSRIMSAILLGFYASANHIKYQAVRWKSHQEIHQPPVSSCFCKIAIDHSHSPETVFHISLKTKFFEL